MSDITIRPVRRGDFDALMALLNGGQQKSVPSRLLPESIRRKIEGADQSAFRLVALDAEAIVGEATLSLLAEAGRLTITVHEEYRGRGIGTALLAVLIAKGQEQPGMKRMALDVFGYNEAALRLDRNFGCEIEARRVDRNGREIFAMRRTIA